MSGGVEGTQKRALLEVWDRNFDQNFRVDMEQISGEGGNRVGKYL